MKFERPPEGAPTSAHAPWQRPGADGRALAVSILLALLLPIPAVGQSHDAGGAPARREIRIDGPPPPEPPAVINRDGRGGATVRAVRLTEPLRLDGRLTEAVYDTVPPFSGFVQNVPVDGAPASERTEAWITFDERNVYVTARVWDSAPESEWMANEIRRDSDQVRENDSFGVVFDTFYDRRNGVLFYTNPLGARADVALTNESTANSDWNPVWDVRTGRFDGGWTVEMEIPFKSLRYRRGSSSVWGVQMRRGIRRKNEWVFLTHVPRTQRSSGAGGAMRISEGATLVGIEPPPEGMNFEVKPYGISGAKTDRVADPPTSNDLFADAGVDAKYGVTRSLTADLTYNTDFAQVEVDQQQVNLTRFNLFFPEKREFFLEGRGIFDFATGGPTGGRDVVVTAPTLFFSRRIGLHEGEPVPIIGGGRLTGKVGPFDLGAVSIQTDKAERLGLGSTNFTVLRLRRDVFRRSNIGALFARRSRSTVGDGSNGTYGVDGVFSFDQVFNVIGYYARTRTPGLTSGDDSYQGLFNYAADEWGAEVRHLKVGENFNPEVGFVRRVGFRQSLLSGRFSPRPESIESVRQLTFQAKLDYIENAGAGFLETRQREGQFQIEFENGDLFDLSFTDTYEFLEEPFRITPEVTVPPGGYAYRDVQVGYTMGPHRWYLGKLTLQRGSFFGGDRTSVSFERGRMALTPRLSVEPTVSLNWVELPRDTFSTHLAIARVNYGFTPRMFASGLVQYSSSNDTFSTNLRLRWEYRPGSELFVVYTSERDTDVLDRFSRLSNRALVVKVTRLFRF